VQRALLVLLVAASYLLFAGMRWTLYPLLVLAAVGALTSFSSWTFERRFRALDCSLAALLVAIAVQLVPLPAAVVQALSPHAAAIRATTQFAVLGAAAPTWLPLSVNPEATLISLGTVALGVLSFWIARAVFSAGGATRTCLKWLTFLGTLAAVMAVIQRAVAPRTILFLIEPDARSANPFGAFMNRNHFAGWLLLLTAPVCGYLIARTRIHPWRRGRFRESFGRIMSSGVVFTGVAVCVLIGVLLLTLSRSAVAGLGVAAVAGWALGRSRLHLERTSLPTQLGLVGAVLMVTVLFVDIDGWATRIEQSLSDAPVEFSRITIWRESMPIVEDFWLTGTGAGTYSEAMTVYQQSRVWVGSMQRWAHFNNAHSHYVQVASEGGLLLGLPALAVLIAMFAMGLGAVRADQGEMFWVRVGAAAGLAGLAAQSIWEVSLTLPANAVLCGVLAGLLLYRRDPTRADLTPTPGAVTPDPVRVRMA